MPLRMSCASSYQGGSAKGWILSIARHTALDMVKKQSRIHLTEEELPAAETPKGMVEDEVICLDALNSLGETEREVVILRVYCPFGHYCSRRGKALSKRAGKASTILWRREIN